MEEFALIADYLDVLQFQFWVRNQLRMVFMAPKRTSMGTRARKSLAMFLNLLIFNYLNNYLTTCQNYISLIIGI